MSVSFTVSKQEKWSCSVIQVIDVGWQQLAPGTHTFTEIERGVV